MQYLFAPMEGLTDAQLSILLTLIKEFRNAGR